MSTIKANKLEHISTSNGGIQLDNAGHVTVDGQQMPTTGPLSNRNILINGDCRVAQRTTASQSHSAVGSIYGVDRFYAFANATGKVTVQQNQGSVTPPAGFQNYVGITSSSAYTPTVGNVFSFGQPIEAQNAAQLSWGTADAKAVTLSFWVRSSLTGTFGGAFLKQGINRSYLYTYTVNSANTWEYKTITIPGDTDTSISYNMSGNGLFGYFIWDYGTGDNGRGTAGTWTSSYKEGVTGTNRLVNTSGATWYITGIQLEVGEKATPFEHRSYGDELVRCQRYYYEVTSANTNNNVNQQGVIVAASATTCEYLPISPVPMRTAPTVSLTDDILIVRADDGSGGVAVSLGGQSFTALPNGNGFSGHCWLNRKSGTGFNVGNTGRMNTGNTAGKLAFTAEL